MGTKSEVSISLTLTVCPTLVILCDPALPNLSTRPETLPSVFFFPTSALPWLMLLSPNLSKVHKPQTTAAFLGILYTTC